MSFRTILGCLAAATLLFLVIEDPGFLSLLIQDLKTMF